MPGVTGVQAAIGSDKRFGMVAKTTSETMKLKGKSMDSQLKQNDVPIS